MDKRLQAKIAERSAVRALERARIVSDMLTEIGCLVVDEEVKTRVLKIGDEAADLAFVLSQRAKI